MHSLNNRLLHVPLPHTLKSNNLCMNCLQPGHFMKQCKSLYRCRHCQKQKKLKSLLMTCRVLVCSSDGSLSSPEPFLTLRHIASFVSERLVRSLRLHQTGRQARIFGVAGLSHDSLTQSITHFVVDPEKKIDVTAVIIPRVTHSNTSPSRLSGLI